MQRCNSPLINGARLWKEGVPEYVQLQVMHQLAVTGKQYARSLLAIIHQFGNQLRRLHFCRLRNLVEVIAGGRHRKPALTQSRYQLIRCVIEQSRAVDQRRLAH